MVIYGLFSTRDRVIRYVGKTRNVTTRLKGHLKDNANTDKVAWIQGELTAGYNVEIVTLIEQASGFDEQRILDVYGATRGHSNEQIHNIYGTLEQHELPTKAGLGHGSNSSECMVYGDIAKQQGITVREAIRQRKGL